MMNILAKYIKIPKKLKNDEVKPKEFDIKRFEDAYQTYFVSAYAELSTGHKETHWMWFIFPQLQGLGYSSMSYEYGISCKEEAKAFLQNEYLNNSLHMLCRTLLKLETNNALEVFGSPDDLKLKSSMTLFSLVSPDDETFKLVLDKFFNGEMCERTIKEIKDIDEFGPWKAATFDGKTLPPGYVYRSKRC